jgi:hypothetical protein
MRRSLVVERDEARRIAIKMAKLPAGPFSGKKWRVSRVELLEGGLLFRFVLYDKNGRPCVSSGYATAESISCGTL